MFPNLVLQVVVIVVVVIVAVGSGRRAECVANDDGWVRVVAEGEKDVGHRKHVGPGPDPSGPGPGC